MWKVCEYISSFIQPKQWLNTFSKKKKNQNDLIFSNMSFDKYTSGKRQQKKLKLGDYDVNS